VKCRDQPLFASYAGGVKGSEVQVYPGWEVRGRADDVGWHPLIGFDLDLTVQRGTSDSKLKLPLGQFRLPAEQTEKVLLMPYSKA
jgi:hypothetical protein